MKIDFVEVYINKADALLQLNRWVGFSEMQHVYMMWYYRTEETKVSYEKSIQYDPNYVDAYYNVSLIAMIQ